ncbi:MAG: hypothetical protein NXI20_15410 [bacterium]|nr:hypothetical protein [bacterium]
MLRKSESEVIISDYSYKCLLSGIPTTKTLIVIPDEIESRGIIAINKPMSQVEVTDIIKIYSRIK